jgi:hypothetical protein
MPKEQSKAWREAVEAALERLYPGVSAGSIPERFNYRSNVDTAAVPHGSALGIVAISGI